MVESAKDFLMTFQPQQPNAFQSVRPRAVAGPSATPIKIGVGAPPQRLNGSLARDAAGRLRVPLEPRTDSGFHIESKVNAQSGTDKRRAIARTNI